MFSSLPHARGPFTCVLPEVGLASCGSANPLQMCVTVREVEPSSDVDVRRSKLLRGFV